MRQWQEEDNEQPYHFIVFSMITAILLAMPSIMGQNNFSPSVEASKRAETKTITRPGVHLPNIFYL